MPELLTMESLASEQAILLIHEDAGVLLPRHGSFRPLAEGRVSSRPSRPAPAAFVCSGSCGTLFLAFGFPDTGYYMAGSTFKKSDCGVASGAKLSNRFVRKGINRMNCFLCKTPGAACVSAAPGNRQEVLCQFGSCGE